MIKSLNITTAEEKAMQQVFSAILAYCERSPNMAAILDLSQGDQEKVQHVLNRIKITKATDGRNVYKISRTVPDNHSPSGARHSNPKRITASATHADH